MPASATPAATSAPVVSNRTITYAYDGLYRLTGVQENPSTDYTYAYDLAGNRTDGNRSYNAANQVNGWQYDAAGNLTSDGTRSYAYDALNRLTQQGATAYGYNGDGTLVQRGTTRYTQDLISPLSEVLNDGSANYIYGMERLLAQTGVSRTWYQGDALGSVRQTLSNTGGVLSAAQYDPWGVVEAGSAAPFGFTGELSDGGLTYLRARWYNPAASTFINRDAFAGFAETPYSLHSYQYAYANSVLLSDPSGKCLGYLWGDPNCRFAGTDYTKYDYAGAGQVVVTGLGVAASVVACVGTAGLACAAGSAGAAAVASWGNQALDNAGQPVANATT